MLGIFRKLNFGGKKLEAKIEAALKVESIERSRLADEIGEARRAEYSKIRLDHQQRGMLESGPHFAALHRCELEHLKAWIKGIVSLRKQTLNSTQEVSTAEHYRTLREEINRMIEGVMKNIPQRIRASGLCYPEHPNTPKDDMEIVSLKALAANEIEILSNSFLVESFNATAPAVSFDSRVSNKITVALWVLTTFVTVGCTWWATQASRSQSAKPDGQAVLQPFSSVSPPPKVEVKPEPKAELKPPGQADLTGAPKPNAVQSMINSPGGVQALGNVTVASDRRLIHSLVLKVVMELETAELSVTQPGDPTMNLWFGPALGVFAKDKTLYRFASEGQFKSEQVAPTARRYTFSYKPESEEQLLGKPIEVLAIIEQLGINAKGFLEMAGQSLPPNNGQLQTLGKSGAILSFTLFVNGVPATTFKWQVKPIGALTLGEMSMNVAQFFSTIPSAYGSVASR